MMNDEWESLRELVQSREDELKKLIDDSSSELLKKIAETKHDLVITTLKTMDARLREIEKRLPPLDEDED